MYNPYITTLEIVTSNFIQFVKDYTGWLFFDTARCIVIEFAHKHATMCSTEEELWELLEAAENELECFIPGPDEYRRGREEYGMSEESFRESWEGFVVDLAEQAYAAQQYEKMHN